jgi:hypothetical protein
VTSEATEVLKLLEGKSNVRMVAGNFRSLDGLRAVVDFDGGRVPAHFATAWRPVVNDPVWVLVADGVAWLVGPTAPAASDGVVVSVASGLATIDTDIGQIIATYDQGATLTAGQEVKLLASGGYHVVAVKSTSPVAPEPAPGGGGSGGGGGAEQTQTFLAVDSGSYQSGWWTRRVYASSSNQGVYVYGTKIADTIPASAVILSVDIFLSAVQIFGGDPIFTTHAYGSRPGGDPGLSGGVAVDVNGTGWWPLPAWFGDGLKAGGGALGVGTNHGGYNIFDAAPGESGSLRIRYRT